MTRDRQAIWWEGRDREGVRFEAPEEYGEAWVRLRPLTWREALEREALACTEEFELDAAGVVQRVIRRFDAEAARRVELRRCLVGWCLPEEGGETASPPAPLSWQERGDTGSAGRRSVAPELAERLLEGLTPGMARWLESCLEKVNLRRPADRAALEEVKKS